MKQFTLIFGLIFAQWLAAQPFEAFNFTGLVNANGWTTHSGTAGQLQAITTPSNSGNSLSFAALENSAGNRIQLTAGNSEDVNKPLANITGIGYYSFLLNVPSTVGLHANAAAGDYFIGFGGASGNTVTILAGRVFVKAGNAPNTFVLGLLNQSGTGSATSYFPTEYPCGTTVFIVVKLDATVTNIAASMWINPTPGTMEPAATITNNSGANGLANFASMFIRQGGTAAAGTGNVEIDEIRAGSNWYQVTPCNTPTSYYADADGDGFGNPNAQVNSCLPLPGLVANNLDCNDSLASVNPNTVWYMDMDNDGFGDLNMTTTACLQPAGYVADSSDCDDNDSTASMFMTYYQDFDGDGFGNAGAPMMNCGQPVGYVADSTDCDDSNDNTYPGAPEICDEADNNCDGVADEGLPTYTLYEDLDEDGFGSEISVEYCDSIVIGWSLINGDCDDDDSTIYPGATEILNNNIDENCDGMDNYAGTTELQQFSASIYPNPSEGTVFVTLSNALEGNLIVSDLSGKILGQWTGITSGYALHTDNWAAGTYFITVVQAGQPFVATLMVK